MSGPRGLASRVLRRILRTVYPEYESQQQQLGALARRLKELGIQTRDQVSRQEKALGRLVGQLDKLPTREDVHAVGRRLDDVGTVLRRHDRAVTRLLRRGDARTEPSREERRILQRLDRLAASDRPIVVGPWSGEVGFELLYWIPFVRWFRERYELDPARLLIVSRGGTSSWYSVIGTRYVDAFSFVTPEEFRAVTDLAKKQRRLTRFDVALLRKVVSAGDIGRVRVLHPQTMYQLFWQFWKERVAVRRVEQYTSYAPIGLGGPQDLPPGLPATYVAVRFYFSACFPPDTPANRMFVADTIAAISQVTDVVLLNTPFRVDDHVDCAGTGSRVHTIAVMPPDRNLAIQTAVIRGAQAFVGTYGGYAYLAPLCGVPSLAFYSAREFFQHHLDVAQRVVASLGQPSLIVLDTRDAGLLRAALSGTGAVAVSELD